MAMPLKGTRTIDVDGVLYSFQGDLEGGVAVAVVEAKRSPGQRLMARFEPFALTGEVASYLSKNLVRIAIVEGLKRGWRPREPGSPFQLREADVFGEHPPPPWATDPEGLRLLQSILASPDEVEPRLVYADWLMERGDPRGELIRLQCTGAPQEVVQPLLQRYWRRWSAPVQGLAQRWTFHQGFLDDVRCMLLPPRERWEALHAREPVRSVELRFQPTDQDLAWLRQPTHRSIRLPGNVTLEWP